MEPVKIAAFPGDSFTVNPEHHQPFPTFGPVDLGLYQGPQPDPRRLQYIEDTRRALVGIQRVAASVTDIMRFKSGPELEIGNCTDQITDLAMRALYLCEQLKRELDRETYAKPYKVDGGFTFTVPGDANDTQSERRIPDLFTQETSRETSESGDVSNQNGGQAKGEVYQTL